MLSPFRFAIKRKVIKGLMEEHKLSRQEARKQWQNISDQIIHESSMKEGVNPATLSGTTILEWIKNNWMTIAKIALQIISILMMFAKENKENKESVRTGNDPGDEDETCRGSNA